MKKRVNLIIVIISTLLSLVIVDYSLGLLNLTNKKPIIKINTYQNFLHPILGPVLKKNNIHKGKIITKNNDLVYEATYQTDQYRRRKTDTLFQEDASKHIILAGCSMVYGEGLSDNETLDYYLSKLIPQSNVYNYGVHGHGPHNFLLRLQNSELENEISPNENGIMIYLLGTQHFKRIEGDIRSPYSFHDPHYKIVNDQLIHDGKFINQKKFKSYLGIIVHRLKKHSNIAQIFFDLLLGKYIPSKDTMNITIEILKEIDRLYSNKNRKFIVWFGQYEKERNQITKTFISKLKESGLTYYISNHQFNTIHPLDGHPDSESNQRLAKEIYDYIRK